MKATLWARGEGAASIRVESDEARDAAARRAEENYPLSLDRCPASWGAVCTVRCGILWREAFKFVSVHGVVGHSITWNTDLMAVRFYDVNHQNFYRFSLSLSLLESLVLILFGT